MPEPLCYTCAYGGLVIIVGDKKLCICHRRGSREVEPQYSCPFYEREEDGESELLEWGESEWEEVIP